MTKRLRLYCLLVLCFAVSLFSDTLSFAQLTSPEAVIEEALIALKARRNLSAMVDYADWKYIYDSLDSKARSAFSADSPDALREFNRRFYLDPTPHMRRQIETEMKNRGSNQRALSQSDQERIIEVTAKQIVDLNNRLARTRYKIAKASVDGSEASVPVRSELDGREAELEIKLHLRDGRWLLRQFPPTLEAQPDSPRDPNQQPGVLIQ